MQRRSTVSFATGIACLWAVRHSACAGRARPLHIKGLSGHQRVQPTSQKQRCWTASAQPEICRPMRTDSPSAGAVSKEGYEAAFQHQQLKEELSKCRFPVYALGGEVLLADCYWCLLDKTSAAEWLAQCCIVVQVSLQTTLVCWQGWGFRGLLCLEVCGAHQTQCVKLRGCSMQQT